MVDDSTDVHIDEEDQTNSKSDCDMNDGENPDTLGILAYSVGDG